MDDRSAMTRETFRRPPALQHGRYTAEEIANRREIAALLQTMRALARAAGEGE